MIRTPFYISIVVIAAIGLWISLHLRKKTIEISALIPAEILSLLYGLFMSGRAMEYCIANKTLIDPPGHDILAAVSNGVMLAWCLIALIIVVDRRRHE